VSLRSTSARISGYHSDNCDVAANVGISRQISGYCGERRGYIRNAGISLQVNRELGALQPKRLAIDDSADWQYLAACVYGLVPIDEFEQWVYATPRLEQRLGIDRYLELISFDFHQPHVRHELVSLLRAAFLERRPSGVERDVAKWVASAYLGERIDLRTTSRVLAQLRAMSHDWVPSEFSYIDSELDDIPPAAQYHQWDPAALAEKLTNSDPRLRAFELGARTAAKAMLNALEGNARGA
jgi:hypothetical protein